MSAYPLALLAVVAAAALAFVVEHLVPAPSLALVFVLPVLAAAFAGGWGPSLFAAVASVLTFDFLFVTPRYSLRIESPADLWALSLLIAVAVAASVVAEQSRRRAMAARRATARTEAFRELARLAAGGAPRQQRAQAAAQALADVFGASAAVVTQGGTTMRILANAGHAKLSAADLEAAGWAIANGTTSHGGEYPFDRSAFEIWPAAGAGLALAVDRSDRSAWPDDSALYFEIAAALLTAPK